MRLALASQTGRTCSAYGQTSSDMESRQVTIKDFISYCGLSASASQCLREAKSLSCTGTVGSGALAASRGVSLIVRLLSLTLSLYFPVPLSLSLCLSPISIYLSLDLSHCPTSPVSSWSLSLNTYILPLPLFQSLSDHLACLSDPPFLSSCLFFSSFTFVPSVYTSLLVMTSSADFLMD